MSKFTDKFKKRLESMPQDELDTVLEELKHWNEVGPTCDEYFAWLKEVGLYPQK